MSDSLDPRLNEVAAALAALSPHPPALNRDRLLFNAGRASTPPPWVWRGTTVASTTFAVVLAAMLCLRPTPPPVERIVYLPAVVRPPAVVPIQDDDKPPIPPAEAESPYSWPTTPYSRLENRVLRWGLDGLAEPTPPRPPPDTLDSLLRSL